MAKPFVYSSIFGDLTRAVQLRFDAVSKLHKQLFDNILYPRFLDWDTPTYGLNFEELIGQYNVTVMAPTIGDNSKESIVSPEGLETFKSKILNHAITRPMKIEDYRKIMQLMESSRLTDQAKRDELIKTMWGNVQTVVESVEAKIDYIFLKALFNKGVCTFDADDNPEGGVRGSIDFNMPAENKGATSATAWTKENKTNVDCLEDIQQVVELAQDKVTFDRILAAPATVSYMLRTAKVRQALFGSDKSARTATIRDLNDYLAAAGWPQIETVRRQVRVQKPDGKRVATTPLNPANLVFIPAGKLGVIKNAWADSELKPEPGVAYSNYGRIRVSQWGAGEVQGSNGVEFTKAQAYALPVITEINGIYNLNTQYVAPTNS